MCWYQKFSNIVEVILLREQSGREFNVLGLIINESDELGGRNPTKLEPSHKIRTIKGRCDQGQRPSDTQVSHKELNNNNKQ